MENHSMSTAAFAKDLDRLALDRLRLAVECDVETGLYDGAVLIVARGGQIGLHEAIGYADRGTGRRARADDVFRILSLTKAFTNLLTLVAIERGHFALTTRVAELIPEFPGSDRFRGAPKQAVTIKHLLTHTAALASTPYPLPPLELGDLAATIAAICEIDLVGTPGRDVNYSPALAHALLGECVRRTLGRGGLSRDVVRDELFEPLGLTGTAIGAPSAWRDRLVPLTAKFPPGGWLGPDDIEIMNAAVSEDAEMPWVGGVSTAEGIFRFAEMLRRGGEFDGSRIVSPAMLELATTNQTGAKPNDLYVALAARPGWEVAPANVGLGFMLRGEGLYHHQFGTLATPRTFGNYGAGSTLFWVDPARELTFVCLTAGVLDQAPNVVRFQRLSDMAHAAAV
jgi:CubicO group peptidase (beta-lactamase class C family)